jgi:beta-lactamase class A
MQSEVFWRSKRFRRRQPRLGRGLLLLVIFGLIAGGLVQGGRWLAKTPLPHGFGQGLRLASAKASPLISMPRKPKGPPVKRLPPFPGPASLQHSISGIAADFGEPVGIAVEDVGKGWAVSVLGDRYFPQQSVSKTWVALTVLEAVDQGQLTLDSPVIMGVGDRSVFNQPLGRAVITDDGDGYHTTVANLLAHALEQSDNSANDTLIRVVGLPQVRTTLTDKGLNGIHLGADERHLQAMIAGLIWQPSYGEGRNFEQARAKLDKPLRQRALDAYLAQPADGATPLGVVQGLSALARGELLSPTSQETLLHIMQQVKTGPMRLKGGLPPGWTIAHKTGTGQDFAGASIGINDIAILTAPDQHQYAVAVFIPYTRQRNELRLAMMQSVTRAVAAYWAGQAA